MRSLGFAENFPPDIHRLRPQLHQIANPIDAGGTLSKSWVINDLGITFGNSRLWDANGRIFGKYTEK